MDTLPPSLAVNKPYESDPSMTELGHTTATEQALYHALTRQTAALGTRLQRPLRVLDVCAAGGGAAWHAIQAIPFERLVLLDIDEVMCLSARRRNWPIPDVEVVQSDAATWQSSERFDVILANSAYHHIEDERKVMFLKNMDAHLTSEGRMLVGDHLLPDYADIDLASFRRSVQSFYEARILELEQRGDDSAAIEVIRQTGRYCWERRYEYQVSHRVFLRDIAAAGLICESMERLWPSVHSMGLPEDSGTFCVILRASTQEKTAYERRSFPEVGKVF